MHPPVRWPSSGSTPACRSHYAVIGGMGVNNGDKMMNSRDRVASSLTCDDGLEDLVRGFHPLVTLSRSGARIPLCSEPGQAAANSRSWGARSGHLSKRWPEPRRAASLRSIHSRSPHGGSTNLDPRIRAWSPSEVARVW
jgi:hypothetical protein